MRPAHHQNLEGTIMKKLLSILTTAALLTLSVPAFGEAPTSTPATIAAGSVQVYDINGVKLHAYSTGDALADVCYALETADAVVLIESPAFKDNLAAWNEYLTNLGKPIAGALFSYHPNGADAYGEMDVYATQHATESWSEGGGIRALTDNFVGIFGDAFDNVMPDAAQIIRECENVNIGGLDFNIVAAGDDAYGIEIPKVNSVYRHMMGSNAHNILASIGHIDATIAELKGYQDKGYALVLTSHAAPEGQDAIATKIAYLETEKKLAQSSDSAEAFIAAMNEAFPDYQGANYLEMTAGFLFPQA